MRKLIFILFYFISISINATTYYVSTTGNDGNTGTISSPLKTITHAVNSHCVAGDMVIVRDGTYYEDVSTSRDGTVTNRIIIKSENKWGAKIVGVTQSWGVWINSGDYVNIEDFDISASVDPIENDTGSGLVNYGDYVIISGNKVHHIPANTGAGGGSGINTFYSASLAGAYPIVKDNVVFDIGYASTSPQLVHGIYIYSPHGEYYRNIVYDIPGWGIHSWHNGPSYYKVFNNTVFASRGGILVGADGDVVDYCEVRNNILFDLSYYGIREWGDVGTHNIYSNNLFFNTAYNYYFINGSSSNDVYADPLFVNYQSDGTGDYTLKSGSPAIDRGLDVGLPYSGFAPDIGAFESDESPINPTYNHIYLNGIKVVHKNNTIIK